MLNEYNTRNDFTAAFSEGIGGVERHGWILCWIVRCESFDG
jgi:hypothetical protein